MDAVRASVTSVLPSISDDVLDNLIRKLDGDGIESLADCCFLNESDLVDILKPIQVRKLLAHWKAGEGQSTVSSSTPSSASSSTSTSSAKPTDVTTPVSQSLKHCTPPTTNWAVNFSVDCSRFSEELMSDLTVKRKPAPKLRLEFVRDVVKQIMKVSPRPGRQNLRIIAGKIVDRWTGCFDDKLGDLVVGSGSETLFLQLENGIDNQNRGAACSTVRKRLAVGDNDVVQSSKKTNPSVDQYGCVDSNPKGLPAGETPETLEQKRQLMVEISKGERFNDDEVEDLIKSTYCCQRRKINEGKHLLSDILLAYPLLFSRIGLYSHFEKLTGVAMSTLHESMTKQLNHVMSFMASLTAPMVKQTLEKIQVAKKQVKCNQPELLGMVCLFASFFEEDTSSFLLLRDCTATASDINAHDLPPHPCLIVLGSSVLTGDKFFLAVDQVVVADDITAPDVALGMAFACYFVFGIKYPEDLPATFEFIQRCLLRINPHRGTKARPKKAKMTASGSASRSKLQPDPINTNVVRLANLLNNHNSSWTLE